MKRWVAIMLAVFMLIPTASVMAETQPDLIRVGLSAFKGKSSLSISTESVTMGYCRNSSYTQEFTLNSTSGFVFKPASGYYCISDQTYNSYDSAKTVADKFNHSYDVTVYPASVDQKSYALYLGGSSTKATVTAMKKAASGKFGISFADAQSNNKQRILVTGEDDSMIYDAGNSGMYLQVASASSNSDGVKTLTIGGKQYRGRIEIGTYGSASISAVNVLPMDEYLYGVVPSEMPSSWPAEALKTQAVVARTYALSKAGYTGDSNTAASSKLDDTTASQVYKGYSGEATATNAAVDKTSKELIYSDGKLIDATFFSTSGGATANSEDVWSSAVSYLRNVADLEETEPAKAPWLVNLTAAQIQSKMTAKGQKLGTIVSVLEQAKTDYGYLSSVKVNGSASTLTIQKDSIRSYFGLYSNKAKIIAYGDKPDQVAVISANGKTKTKQISNCNVISANNGSKKMDQNMDQYIVMSANNLTNFPREAPAKKDTYIFAGMGYGHGVGMSQSGAKGMANNGASYKEIIKHYYTGVTVK